MYTFSIFLDTVYLFLFDLGFLALVLSLFLIFFSSSNNTLFFKNLLFISSFFFFIIFLLIFLFNNVADNHLFLSEFGWFSLSFFSSNILCLNFWLYPISSIFVLISVLLILICTFIHRYTFEQKRFYSLLLILELLLILIFLTSNTFLFYICFECSLIPMFIIIGVWGSKERKIRASYLFLMYSVIGSFLFLTSLLYILIKYNTMDLVDIQLISIKGFSFYEELLLWLGCFFSFAVKTPLVPFHLWLPEAHVEAPTAGSVMLAGILLKMGSYGFIRFNYTLFSTASHVFSPYLFLLGVLGVLYACSAAFLQFDIKKIIAYSSVAHMSVITLGLFTMNNIGFLASVISMIAHSFVASGLFLCIGILYEKFQTRNIFYYGGLFRIMPLFSVFFFILSFANIAFPGTLSFLGEFFILQGMLKTNIVASIFLFVSFILSSVYVLFLLNRLLFTNFKLINIYNTINTNFYDIIPYSYFKHIYKYSGSYSKLSTNAFFYSLLVFVFLTIFFGIISSDLFFFLEQDLLLITKINYN